jgi:MFS family permease
VTNTTTQLEINIILNAWCLIISLFGTAMADKLGRKALAATSTGLLTIFIFMVGALTKVYGNSNNNAGIYGTVASIFLFQGAYSFGWTPLTVLYPPEVLNYEIRSVGMGIYTFLVNGVGLMVTFAFPFALAAIGWKTYMINGAWDVLEFIVVIIAWVETRNRTLEEIDGTLDGEIHSDAPKLSTILGMEPEERGEVIEAIGLSKDKEIDARTVLTELVK